jgi:hypothetical protein
MNKITAEHLARRAFVYIRQTAPEQVQKHLEIQRATRHQSRSAGFLATHGGDA